MYIKNKNLIYSYKINQNFAIEYKSFWKANFSLSINNKALYKFEFLYDSDFFKLRVKETLILMMNNCDVIFVFSNLFQNVYLVNYLLSGLRWKDPNIMYFKLNI